MNSSSGQAIASSVNTLQNYDDKLKIITEELKRVQYERNLLVPICRLPAEILGSIFTFYTDSWTRDDRSFRTSRRHRAGIWMDILLVCRLWCSIAYNTPSMWSTPDFMYPKMARSVLKHSKSSPLNVRWDFLPTYLDSDHKEVFQEAMSRPWRIATLNLQASSEMTRGFLAGSLEKMTEPAPLMTSVRISSVESGGITLPKDFLGGDAPRLTELELTSCTFPWESSLVGNLTTLTIKRLGVGNQLSVRDVLEVMSRAQGLKIIQLENCLSPNRVGPPIPPENSSSFIVELPNLISLSVSVESEMCCTLLQHMSFPGTAQVHFETRYPSIPEVGFDSLFTYVSGLLASSSTSPDHPRAIKSLKVHIDDTKVKFITWNVSSDSIEELEDFHPPQLWMELETMQEAVAELTPRVLELGPLAHLENFMFVSSESPPVDMILRFLGGCSRLETLFLVGQAPFEFVKALSRNLLPRPVTRKTKKRKSVGKGKGKRKQRKEEEEEVAEGEGQGEEASTSAISQPILFPVLKTLGLMDVDFREESRTLLKPLLTALKLRAEHGSPLEKVILEQCLRLYGPDVEKIEKRVEVDWDGDELDEDDDGEEFYDDDVLVPPFFPFHFLPSMGFYDNVGF